jgi:hypothetical protein
MGSQPADTNLSAEEQLKRQDRYETGVDDVHSVNDLAPESHVAPSRARHEQQRMTHTGDFAGKQGHGNGGAGGDIGLFEEAAVHLGTSIAAPLNLGAGVLRDGGGRLAEYQAGYNMYAAPLRSTVRAMGRVKDMSLTGAPRTPAELLANPALAKRFRRLSLTAHQDAAPHVAANAWAANQARLSVDVAAFAAGQMMLKSSIENWHSIQALLKQRKVEAARGAKEAELHEIEEAAATCAKIVEFSMEAWNAAGEINKALEEMAELNEEPEERPGPEEDVRSRGHRAIDKAGAAAGKISGTTKVGKELRERISGMTAQKLTMSLEDVFVVAMGNGQKKVELAAAIAKLTAQMSNLKITEADWHIKEGRTRLDGFKLELSQRKASVQIDRQNARTSAAAFNQALTGGGETEGLAAMYMAEAQQELATFGRAANQLRGSAVDPHWRWADAYINDNYDRLVGHELGDDARKLANNVVSVRDQRTYFATHLPEWEQNAQAWRRFLEEQTQKPFGPEPSRVDRESDAP